MSKVFQIVNGFCHWQTPFKDLSETVDRYPSDCLFVEAPDYVNEQWGYDGTKEGDERFIKPVAPEGWIYDDDTGTFIEKAMIPVMLEESKNAKQNENKNMLSSYLSDHPITFTDGKKYGITMEDQSEIALNLQQYEIAVQMKQANQKAAEPILEWHSIHEACTPWTKENLIMLAAAIQAAVYPAFQLMNKYKEKIYGAADKAALAEIKLKYNEDIVQWMADGRELDDYLDPDDLKPNTSETETNGDSTESKQ